jgi:hypothetical protein
MESNGKSTCRDCLEPTLLVELRAPIKFEAGP